MNKNYTAYLYFWVFLLLSFSVNAQNSSVIKETFYGDQVNNIDQTAAENNIASGEKLYLEVEFKADETGQIFDIYVPTKHTVFEKDIVRIVSKIPALDPDEYLHKGNIMRYKLSMRIKLPGKSKRKKMQEKGESIRIDFEHLSVLEYFPLKNIDIAESFDWKEKKADQFPETKNCKTTMGSKDELMNCLTNEVNSFVNRNFDVGLAAEIGLLSGRYKVEVSFYISTKGEIVNITAESPYPELSEEAVRVINSLPDFTSPAMKDGKPVIIRYTLPIRFVIA
jgi:hypothetical protein